MIGKKGKLEIFLVEDNKDDAELIASSLDPGRYNIINVWNGQQALEMQLEDMDGVLVIEQLEKTGHPPVVILCSSRPQEQLKQITASHPIVKGYVTKPFNIDELINAIG